MYVIFWFEHNFTDPYKYSIIKHSHTIYKYTYPRKPKYMMCVRKILVGRNNNIFLKIYLKKYNINEMRQWYNTYYIDIEPAMVI